MEVVSRYNELSHAANEAWGYIDMPSDDVCRPAPGLGAQFTGIACDLKMIYYHGRIFRMWKRGAYEIDPELAGELLTREEIVQAITGTFEGYKLLTTQNHWQATRDRVE